MIAEYSLHTATNTVVIHSFINKVTKASHLVKYLLIIGPFPPPPPPQKKVPHKMFIMFKLKQKKVHPKVWIIYFLLWNFMDFLKVTGSLKNNRLCANKGFN